MTTPTGSKDQVPTEDPLAALEVIDRLEVGPVTLLADRLKVPYRVFRDDGEDVFDLAYRYGEEVFDPRSPADHNLAAMIGAQVALNYGLFCHEIVFKGPFDRDDRRFLERMTANTAREIYVNKLLAPNPLLRLPAGSLPADKRRSYTRAKIRFQNGGPTPDEVETTPEKAPWPTDNGRFAISSSGGKDSLLSYGLLSELGCETHPIFINESGRHWWTALNAFRATSRSRGAAHGPSLDEQSDRLFSCHAAASARSYGQDFAFGSGRTSIRSASGPWPCSSSGPCRSSGSRGIGRLVIGDEHDCDGAERTIEGIPHYDGLYDQSIATSIDALSRYFQRKGWGITQFSLLRPLVRAADRENVLAERYPRAPAALQMSCHAAHTEDGERMPPLRPVRKMPPDRGNAAGRGRGPRRPAATPRSQMRGGIGRGAAWSGGCTRSDRSRPQHLGTPAVAPKRADRRAPPGARPSRGSERSRSRCSVFIPGEVASRRDPARGPAPSRCIDRLLSNTREGAVRAARPARGSSFDVLETCPDRSKRPYPFDPSGRGAARPGRRACPRRADLPLGRDDLAASRNQAAAGRRGAAAGGRGRAARAAPAARHRQLRRRLPRPPWSRPAVRSRDRWFFPLCPMAFRITTTTSRAL